MYSDLLTSRLSPCAWTLALGVSAVCAGCAQTGAVRDDIVSIYHYYRPEPWIRDEEKRVVGITARVYFVSAQTEKGVFVPGLIRASLSVLNPRPDGTYERQDVHEWTFNASQAEGFRVRKPSIMGDSYGFVLRWPRELDLAGREVHVRFSYQRTDGRLITGRATPLPPLPSATGRPPGRRPPPTTGPTGVGPGPPPEVGPPHSMPGAQ